MRDSRGDDRPAASSIRPVRVGCGRCYHKLPLMGNERNCMPRAIASYWESIFSKYISSHPALSRWASIPTFTLLSCLRKVHRQPPQYRQILPAIPFFTRLSFSRKLISSTQCIEFSISQRVCRPQQTGGEQRYPVPHPELQAGLQALTLVAWLADDPEIGRIVAPPLATGVMWSMSRLVALRRYPQ